MWLSGNSQTKRKWNLNMTDSKTLDDAMRQQFEGNFLDAIDIPANGITVEISEVVAPNAEKDRTGKNIDKGILAFKGAKKRLVLNKTNSKIIALMHGKKASEWVGKTITLTVRYLEKAFGQRNVPVIRVVPSDDHPMTFGMRKNYGSPTPFVDGK